MEFTFGIALGTIIATLINISFNLFISKNVKQNERKENINHLFGELLNVLCHYQFFEIPMSLVDGPEKNHNEVIKRLELCKYGLFKASENTQNYSFLDATQVRNIHQLALRIRNTDLLIDRYLKSNGDDLNLFYDVHSRMGYIFDSAGLLLDYISQQHPEYKELIQDTKNLEKPKHGI